jgi:hypothetical protein
MFSNTFAGISPSSVPSFVVAQAVGGALGFFVIRSLYQGVTPQEAADILFPHHPGDADTGIVAGTAPMRDAALRSRVGDGSAPAPAPSPQDPASPPFG